MDMGSSEWIWGSFEWIKGSFEWIWALLSGYGALLVDLRLSMHTSFESVRAIYSL